MDTVMPRRGSNIEIPFSGFSYLYQTLRPIPALLQKSTSDLGSSQEYEVGLVDTKCTQEL